METKNEVMDCLRSNPPALYQFLRGGCIFRPQSIPLLARWDSGSVNQAPKKLSFSEQVVDDLIVTSVVYDVERPDYAVGSIDKPFADQQNSLRPGIDIRLNVEGGFGTEQYAVNIRAAPIQNLLSQAQTNGPLRRIFAQGFCLTMNQTIYAEAYLTRELAEGETPYLLRLTVHGIRLGCQGYNGLSSKDAARLLKEEYQIDLLPAGGY